MNLLKTLIIIQLALVISGCKEEKLSLNEDDVYIDYSYSELDSFAKNCENEITKNEIYLALKFNDTVSNTVLRSEFSHSAIVINGKHYQEISLFACRNALVTWSTQPFFFVCSFRVDSESKSLKIFNSESKKFIDFRQERGKNYFEKCLKKLNNIGKNN